MDKYRKMNMNIVEANIKLQDEIKWVKIDNDILQKRNNLARKELKSKLLKLKDSDLEKDIRDVIAMLDGTYVPEDGRKKRSGNFNC